MYLYMNVYTSIYTYMVISVCVCGKIYEHFGESPGIVLCPFNALILAARTRLRLAYTGH